MKKWRIYWGVLFVSFVSLTFTWENDPLRKVLDQLGKYRSEYPQEKIHLHFDKPYYATGDTIWLKAYLVNAEKNQLAQFSKILYVDLINEKDSIEKSLRLPVHWGLASGEFSLSESLPQGNYRVRAYTNWMRNFGEEYYFDKIISIGQVTPDKVTAQNLADVQFFPEGGDLLIGLNSKVAFKAVGPDGLGISVTGFITDQYERKVAEFKTEHLGMGFFFLQPQKNASYQAVVKFNDGSEKYFPLPQTVLEGYSLTCDNTDSVNLKVKISSTGSRLSGEEITLIAQSNGVVHYVAKSKINDVIDGTILKKRFPTGILQLTLFSSANEPLAERLVFINHSDFLNINIKADKPTYSKRSKVKIFLDVKDPERNPTIGSFSAAVTDETKVPFNDDKEITILSNLLLVSDLRGFVEQPNQYFNILDNSKNRNLDLLMLTQGWRRFTWKNILSNSFPELIFKSEKSLEIKGIASQLNGKNLENADVTLFSTEGDVIFLTTKTNVEGKFSFQNLIFHDSTTFVLRAVKPKNKNNVKFLLDTPMAQLVTINKNHPASQINLNSSAVKHVGKDKNQHKPLRDTGMLYGNILLKEVVVTDKTINIRNSKNLNGSGNADAIISGEKLEKYVSLSDGIMFNMPAGISVRNGVFYSTRDGGVQVILDGAFVDQSDLSLIKPNEVEAVEILKEGPLTAIYGTRAYKSAIILVTTKPGGGNTKRNVATPGILTHSPKGFHKVREFYSPDYDNQNIVNKVIPDFRSTIYWSPRLVTDETGQVSFEFYTSDSKGDYKVTVEGINAYGKIGRQVLRFRVN